MSKKMKNIAQSEVLTLREQISYQEGQKSAYNPPDCIHHLLLF